MSDKKYNILYLDDEESNLRIFRAAFKQYYKIYLAKSGMEGIEILKNHDIHLIITDQRMPKMTGVEFLEQIIPDYPDTIRIILTGFSDVEDIIRALNKCGIYRYIVKPWNREEMKLTIDKALETWQLRQDNLNLLGELKDINNSLEEKIKLRTEELTIAKEKAEEASVAKERFLSTMSHEIRTPLNAIIGISHLLQKSPLNAEQQENVDILEFSSKNLLALVNDILDMSKIEAGKVELEKVPFNLQKLLNGVHKTMLPKAEEKGLQLLEDYDPQLPSFVVGDQVRIGQILTNLLGNAVKFTEKGFVKTEVKLLEEDAERALIGFEVVDSGIGIPPDMVDKIFDDFSQASSDTTRKYGGTGLGLSITQKLVQMHKSEMKVSSKLGKGSTFSFSINLRKSEPEEELLQEESPQIEQENLDKLKILVVEDNRFNQAIARKFLTGWNAEVAFANNGVEAVQTLQQDRSYKLVLMDIQMPEMDGYEATRQIRKLPQPYYRDLPIIALTASTLSGEKQKVLDAGMNDYVMKPFNPELLLSTILKHSDALEANMMEHTEEEQHIDTLTPKSIRFERFKRMAENDEDFYKELLEMNIEDYQEFKGDFAKAVAAKDEVTLSEICHKIRPSMITLSLEWLYNDTTEIRKMLQANKPYEKRLQQIMGGLDFSIAKMQEELDKLN